MNNFFTYLLIASIFSFGAYKYNGSTTASVVLAGGVIKAQHEVIDKKYKRKDCPVCKGKGYYISGDGISKVDCGYCEPETKPPGAPVMHPPLILKPNCQSGTCSQPIRK
jgi:hypothetical protein